MRKATSFGHGTRTRGKRLLAAVIALAVALLLPTSVWAEDVANSSEAPFYGYRPTGTVGQTIHDANEGNYSSGSVLTPMATIPAQYSSVDAGMVSPVKDQGTFGVCWTFAAMASSESSVMSQGLSSSGTVPDFSERQLAYFAYHPVADPLNNIAGDSTSVNGFYLSVGGNENIAAHTLATWSGVVDESVAPYSELLEAFENKTSEESFLAETALEASLSRGSDAAHLTGYRIISTADRDDVKQAIMEYGAVHSHVYHDEAFYCEDTKALYNNEIHSSNHAITIVGWDDDFPASNFSSGESGVQPAENGAWLIKNSWGTWYDEGYFWASYEDIGLNGTADSPDSVAFYLYGSVDNYDNNYQYDGTCSSNQIEVPSDGDVANVFTASANEGGREDIAAVSIWLMDTNVDYSVQIYTGLDDLTDPLSGTPALDTPVTGKTSYAGYYTIDLPEAVTVDDGTTFSVVVTVSHEDESAVQFGYDQSFSQSWITFENDVQAGQGFLRAGSDYGWDDLYEGEETRGNLRIKAFTNNVEAGSTSIADATVTVESPQAYTGSALEPAVTVTLNGTELTLGTDYEVTYVDNTAIGTATATVTGAGSYTGQKSVEFQIVKADISGALVASISPQTYDGEAKTPTIRLRLNNRTLQLGEDYTVTYENNVNAGTATAIATGMGNYEGTKTVRFTISRCHIASTNVAAIDNQTYTGSALMPPVVVTMGDKTLVQGTDYYVRAYNNSNVNAGTAVLLITGRKNYSGTRQITFKILPASISSASVDLAYDTTAYDGSEQQPDVTVTLGDKELVAGTDYEVAYADNTNSGTAKVTVTGKGNYTDTVEATFRIDPLDIADADVALEYETAVYTGSELKPGVTVAFGDDELVAGTDYELAYTNNTSVGAGKVTVTGKGNYEGTIEATFRIDPLDITDADVALEYETTAYTGSTLTPSVTVILGGATVPSDGYDVSYADNTGVGTATVTVTGKGNYAGTASKTFQITEAKPFFLDADPADEANHGAEVDWMGWSGISEGWPADGGRVYRGLWNVKRCDFAAFLYRMADLRDDGLRNDTPALSGAEVVETLAGVVDCDASTPHAAEVAWLIRTGISRGWATGDGRLRFEPLWDIKRQDMAAFLYRFADLDDDREMNGSPEMGPESLEFSDVEHGDVASHAPEVEWLASVGVTKGWDNYDGTYSFGGMRDIVRQDMAAFMKRLNDYLNRPAI